MTDALAVRKLAPSDRMAWEALWKGYVTFYESTVSDAVTEHTWERLLGDRVLHGRIAEHQGAPVGIVHFQFHPSTWSPTSYCYLEDLFVAPEARGLGAGRALIEAVYAAAEEAQSTRVYWVTQLGNTTAQALYDRLARKTDFIQYRKT